MDKTRLYTVLIFDQIQYTDKIRHYIGSDGDCDSWKERIPSVQFKIMTFLTKDERDDYVGELPKNTYEMVEHDISHLSEYTTKTFRGFNL